MLNNGTFLVYEIQKLNTAELYLVNNSLLDHHTLRITIPMPVFYLFLFFFLRRKMSASANQSSKQNSINFFFWKGEGSVVVFSKP